MDIDMNTNVLSNMVTNNGSSVNDYSVYDIGGTYVVGFRVKGSDAIHVIEESRKVYTGKTYTCIDKNERTHEVKRHLVYPPSDWMSRDKLIDSVGEQGSAVEGMKWNILFYDWLNSKGGDNVEVLLCKWKEHACKLRFDYNNRGQGRKIGTMDGLYVGFLPEDRSKYLTVVENLGVCSDLDKHEDVYLRDGIAYEYVKKTVTKDELKSLNKLKEVIV
tara:strand:- start:2007 stop:2657 length:651 start_codon:yes stop_codon:yes gene_type:complete